MSDLVGKTALAICLATRGSPEFVSPEGQEALRCEARAAIAAVLDDLESEVREDAHKDLHKWAPKLAEQRAAFDLALLGLIEAKRNELGLASPVGPRSADPLEEPEGGWGDLGP